LNYVVCLSDTGSSHRGSQLYFHITRYVLKRRREDTFEGSKSESRVSAPKLKSLALKYMFSLSQSIWKYRKTAFYEYLLTRWVNNFPQKCQFKSFDQWKLTLIFSRCPDRLEFKNECYSTVNQSISKKQRYLH
jgi:hypothetical protein